MKLPQQFTTSMHRWQPRQDTSHDQFKTYFTEQLYMTGIYQVLVCTCHIPSAARLLACMLSQLESQAHQDDSDRDCLAVSEDPFCFGDQKPSDPRVLRLGPDKLSQPGVDLINMVAPA